MVKSRYNRCGNSFGYGKFVRIKGKIDGKYYYSAPWEAEADAPGGVLGNTFDQKR